VDLKRKYRADHFRRAILVSNVGTKGVVVEPSAPGVEEGGNGGGFRKRRRPPKRGKEGWNKVVRFLSTKEGVTYKRRKTFTKEVCDPKKKKKGRDCFLNHKAWGRGRAGNQKSGRQKKRVGYEKEPERGGRRSNHIYRGARRNVRRTRRGWEAKNHKLFVLRWKEGGKHSGRGKVKFC